MPTNAKAPATTTRKPLMIAFARCGCGFLATAMSDTAVVDAWNMHARYHISEGYAALTPPAPEEVRIE